MGQSVLRRVFCSKCNFRSTSIKSLRFRLYIKTSNRVIAMKLNLFFTISVLSYGVAALSLKPQEPMDFAQDGMLTSA